MSKKEFVEFTCDECKKILMSSWGFPYQQEWVYIHEINGKALVAHTPAVDTEVKFIKGDDLHFCSQKCVGKWMLKNFKTGPKNKKVKKK